MNRTPAPSHVLDSFRLIGAVTPTHSQDVWRVGAIALKRVEHLSAAEWICEMLADRRPSPEFRLPRPIAATGGRWIVDGWTASTWLSGSEDGARWRGILDAAAGFHQWLSDLDRPVWLDQIDDPWRAADRMAWDEEPVAVLPDFVSPIEQLASMRRPIVATSQLVHAELTGNVLFAEGLEPGIIDLTLYWRPPGYAAVIVAVDCFEWEGIGRRVLDHVAAAPDRPQLLVRTAMFRTCRTGMVPWVDAGDRLAVHRRTVSAIAALQP